MTLTATTLSESIDKTSSELLRDRWTLQSFPINHCFRFPIKALRLLSANEESEQRFIEEFTPFVNELTANEYLERINLILDPRDFETHFTFEAQIAHPKNHFVLTTRRWFKQQLPALDDEAIEPLTDLVFETYLTRPVLCDKKGQKEWFRQHNKQRDVAPIRFETVRDDMQALIDEGGLISLRRYGIVLSTQNPNSLFWKKYHGMQTYSVK